MRKLALIVVLLAIGAGIGFWISNRRASLPRDRLSLEPDSPPFQDHWVPKMLTDPMRW